MSDTQRSKIHTRIKLVRRTKKERRRHKARAAAVADQQAKAKANAAKAAARTEAITHARMQGLKGKHAVLFVKRATQVAKKKRGLSPYFAFLADKRAEIKATLEAKGAKISLADVSKAAGAQWKAMNDNEKTKYVVISNASKKEVAEYNEAKAKEITASHELQLQIADSQQTPLVDFNFASEPVSSTQLVDNELAGITFDTAPRDIPRDVWELF